MFHVTAERGGAPRNAVERIFGVCHNCPRLFLQKPMIAMVCKNVSRETILFLWGISSPKHAPREVFSRIHSDHRLLKREAQFVTA